MRLATAALLLSLLAMPAGAERIRVHMLVMDGPLTAAVNAIKGSLLDPRGGGLDTFSVDLQEVGGGGPGWMGCSWVMERNGLDTISLELFVADIIEGLNMKHNTGTANTQIATYVHEDETAGLTSAEGFAVALADTNKKPSALEIVPEEEAP